MATVTLLPENGTAGTVGASALFGSGSTKRNLQFNPKTVVGFTGTVLIEGSSAGSPGATDWVTLAEVVFSAHSQNFSVDMFTDVPWMRAKVTAGSTGAVSIFASAA